MPSHPSASPSVSARKRQEPECCKKQAFFKVSVLLPLQEATCTVLSPRPWALPLELGLAHEHRHTGRQGTTSCGTGEPGISCSRAFSRGEAHSASSREKTRHPCCPLWTSASRAGESTQRKAPRQECSVHTAQGSQRRHLHRTRLTRARATHATNNGLDMDFNLFLGPPCPGASLGAPACRARGARRARSPHTQTARGPSTACREAGGFAAEGGWCAFASGKVLKPWVGGAGATPRGDPAPKPQQPNSHPATDEPDKRSDSHGGQLLGGNLQALCSRPHSPVFTRVSSETPLPGGHLHL